MYCHSPGGDTAAALGATAFYVIYAHCSLTTVRQGSGLGGVCAL